jgi:uncharacterized protein involved in exopolysaccharide biosynthesis
MTVQSSEKPAADLRPASAEEIDLRPILAAIIGWRREIIALTMLAALVAGGLYSYIISRQPPVYQASATIVILRSSSDVMFEETFRTTFDQDTGNTATAQNAARRQATLVGLVANSAIAETVSPQLSADFDETERAPTRLVRLIAAESVASSDNRNPGDLIEISAQATSADKAAELANAWARAYVDYINGLYGSGPAQLSASVINELEEAQAAYDQAQGAVEEFIRADGSNSLERQIAEKQQIISNLQTGKDAALKTIIEEEVAARRQVLSAYVNALTTNRLLLFNKDQEAKRTLLTAILDAEANNRLLAFQNDQDMRRAIFNAYAAADRNGQLAVFNEQVQNRLNELTHSYSLRRHFERLQQDVAGLLAQARAATTPDAISTNALSLLLLKQRVYMTTGDTLDIPLQLNLENLSALSSDAQSQIAELTTMSSYLTARVAELTTAIEEQTALILANDGYMLPDMATGAQMDAADATADGDLAAQMAESYAQLFALSPVAHSSTVMSITTPLTEIIQAQYPALFDVNVLSAVSEQTMLTSTLAGLSQERVQELLQLQGLEDIPNYSTATAPLSAAIGDLEDEVQELQARREAESSRRTLLIAERDLAAKTLTTLQNKIAELQLAETAPTSEVRFAAPALPPIRPVPVLSTALIAVAGAVGGLMAGVVLAIIAHYMGQQPILRRQHR